MMMKTAYQIFLCDNFPLQCSEDFNNNTSNRLHPTPTFTLCPRTIGSHKRLNRRRRKLKRRVVERLCSWIRFHSVPSFWCSHKFLYTAIYLEIANIAMCLNFLDFLLLREAPFHDGNYFKDSNNFYTNSQLMSFQLSVDKVTTPWNIFSAIIVNTKI